MTGGDLREELADLLTEAAEFEHGVCCAYLFPAFALRHAPQEGLGWADLERHRRWAAELMTIAREEMGHLATVANLLAGIGAAPHYVHPEFPYCAAGLTLELRTLDPAVVASFVTIESSEGASAGEPGVGGLYGRVRQLLEAADDGIIVPVTHQLHISLPTSARIDTIPDRATAIRAVSSIVDDGDTGPSSHRERLLRMQREVEEAWAHGDPASSRAVAPNPSLRPGPGRSLVTEQTTRQVLRLFESSYGLMLLLLARLGQGGPESREELTVLSATAYYPMMTMVVRPLGELLTRLPTGDGDGSRAGASFRTPRQTQLPHDRDLTWRRLSESFDDLAAQAEQIDASGLLGTRGTYLAQSLTALTRRFRAGPEAWC